MKNILLILLSVLSIAVGTTPDPIPQTEKLVSNKEKTQKATRKDLNMIATALEAYKIIVGAYPSTEQGLAALVALPKNPPVPKNWERLATAVPKDHWGRHYQYVSKGDSFWLWSQGQNPDSDDDDICYLDQRAPKK